MAEQPNICVHFFTLWLHFNLVIVCNLTYLIFFLWFRVVFPLMLRVVIPLQVIFPLFAPPQLLNRLDKELRTMKQIYYQDFIEHCFGLVSRLYKNTQKWSPSAHYNLNMIHVPCLKVHIWDVDSKKDSSDDDVGKKTANREVWALFQESNLYRSYISEGLVRQMELRVQPASWDPTVQVVKARIKPLSDEIGLPLNLDQEEETRYEKIEELVVLRAEQFGRIDIRIPSQRVENMAKSNQIHVPPLKPEDFLAFPTADIIIGQQMYIKKFLPPVEKQKAWIFQEGPESGPKSNVLAFFSSRRCGSIITGGLGCSSYQEYSTYRVVFLYPIVCLLLNLNSLFFYANAHLILHKYLDIISWDALFKIFCQVMDITMIPFTLRFVCYLSQVMMKCPHQIAYYVDQFLLWVIYRVLGDIDQALTHLAELECDKFQKDWFNWLSEMTKESNMTKESKEEKLKSVKELENPQEVCLPEESRVEIAEVQKCLPMGETRKRYRPVLRALASKNDDSATATPQMEVRIQINRAMDHSLISERAVKRLGLRKRFIWPRFHWGFYPLPDDMCFNYETVELCLNSKSTSLTRTNDPESKGTWMELQIHRGDLAREPSLSFRFKSEIETDHGIALTDFKSGKLAKIDSTANQDEPVDIVIGQDLLNQFFMPISGPNTKQINLLGFDTAMVSETQFGWTFEGFENLDAATSADREESFFESLWNTFGRKI